MTALKTLRVEFDIPLDCPKGLALLSDVVEMAAERAVVPRITDPARGPAPFAVFPTLGPLDLDGIVQPSILRALTVAAPKPSWPTPGLEAFDAAVEAARIEAAVIAAASLNSAYGVSDPPPPSPPHPRHHHAPSVLRAVRLRTPPPRSC